VEGDTTKSARRSPAAANSHPIACLRLCVFGAIMAIHARAWATPSETAQLEASEQAGPLDSPAPGPPPESKVLAPIPATPRQEPGADGAPLPALPQGIAIHGFVSEGGFWSTSNNYIGSSSSGSLKLFEAGINFSTEVADRLRAGLQIFARDFGAFETAPRLDWANLDYRWRTWLGLRAGIIKMPFGLYNEYADIDSARLAILMPQSVYSFTNRDALLSHRGFALYGTTSLGRVGELEYQAWLGTLSVPSNALTLVGARLDSVDTRYVTGAQLFWLTPLQGLRAGATCLRASIDFNLTLTPENTQALIAAGAVPPDYDGALVVSQRPDTWVIGSIQYNHGDWLFAAEYSRTFKHQETSLPSVIPAFDEDSERYYGMVNYRPSPWLEVGSYYSVHYLDANDRSGNNPKFAKHYYAFQRDLAATVRFDVNAHWLWKLEGHFMDGTADLPLASNPHPDRYWGLVLLRTTVTF
jgi:hypothetical protein